MRDKGCIECLLGKGCELEFHLGDTVPGAVLASLLNASLWQIAAAGLFSGFLWPAIMKEHGATKLVPWLDDKAFIWFGVSYFVLLYAKLPLSQTLLFATVIAWGQHVLGRSLQLQERRQQLPPRTRGTGQFIGKCLPPQLTPYNFNNPYER